MNLHEYQSKALFQKYTIPVPKGQVIDDLAGLDALFDRLGGDGCVVKAQVHAGGRGKGGGIQIARNTKQLQQFTKTLLGSNLVTPQTDANGLPVNQLLIEQTLEIKQELYLGLLVDRARRQVVVMASSAGGMDIEAVAASTPEKIHTIYIWPPTGLMPYQGRQLAFALGLQGQQVRSFVDLVSSLYRLFVDNDASLVEINPLVVSATDELIALDGKINLDDNALYRHPDLNQLRDESQEDEREKIARQHDLNYIELDGNIACMVNGAGLAMATMDLIKLHGANPANFLDVGGNATAERVSEAFKLIVSNPKVQAILVNIFGGIVRCDLIAEGIIQAIKTVGVKVPVVVRLEGTRVEIGSEMLEKCDFDILPATGLTEAAQKVIAAAKERS